VGCTSGLDIWETEYLQVLEGVDAVLEWVKGTGLRPILNGLDDEERGVFLQEYARRLRQAYPMRADGRTLYPFRRLFLVATAR
jgi:trans-aconitate 2-methyltransferase